MSSEALSADQGTVVAVTGAAGPVGRRVVALFAEADGVEEVRAFDRRRPSRKAWRQLDLNSDDLDEHFAGVDVVCHLAGSDPLAEVDPDRDQVATARLLECLERVGVGQVVARTSATVYGARPDNPIPITEDAPLRPNHDSPWVLGRVEIERLLEQFRSRKPTIPVAVLRPCVTVSDDGPDGLGTVLAAARLVSGSDDDPGAQFVHADDVAAAVEIAVRDRLDGVFNVAPDGWLDGEMIRALVGGTPRLPLPEDAAKRVTDLGWRYRVAPTPPGFVPFVTQSWVVGNDRLRSSGWSPSHSNEEAFVVGHEAAPWASISPRRRQELALGLAGSLLAAGVGTAVAVARRRMRGR